MWEDKEFKDFCEQLVILMECNSFGMKKGCRKDCPVYEAEQCPNQLSNEKFFKWLESDDRYK